jgi:hypothetical protein
MNDSQWQDILAEAMRRAIASRAEPVPGARLRSLVARLATEKGLTYPPEPDLKFRDFLFRFPNTVKVVIRKGQDSLIVPANRLDLLSKTGADEAGRHLRRDLFIALTRVEPKTRAWYQRDTDQVHFLEAAEAPPDGLIPLPQANYDDEVSLRKEFASTISDSTVRSAVLESTKDQKALTAFSHVIHRNNLRREWQKFRSAEVLSRLQRWAQDNDLAWDSSWIEAEPQERVPSAPAGSEGVQQSLARYILSLSESEIARVQFPGDLVAQLWARVRRD